MGYQYVRQSRSRAAVARVKSSAPAASTMVQCVMGKALDAASWAQEESSADGFMLKKDCGIIAALGNSNQPHPDGNRGSAGMAFGDMAVIERAPRSAMIHADTDVECVWLAL